MTVRKNNRKWLWWGVAILVVALITVAVILIVKNSTRGETSRDEQGQSEIEPARGKEEEMGESEKAKEETSPKKEEVKQYEGGNPNKSETLTGVISYAGVSGDSLIIRVNIDQYLGGGNCKLAILRDGAVIYSATSTIESSVSTSTCNGFDVPISQLGSGKVAIEVVLESDNKYGKIVGEVAV